MSDTDKNKNPNQGPANRPVAADEKAQRLAEALRANLHRRKAQARARAGTDMAETARKERIKNGQA